MHRLTRFISVAATPVVAAALVLSASPSAHADTSFTPGVVSAGIELADFPATAHVAALRSGTVKKSGAIVMDASKWTGVRNPAGLFTWQAIAVNGTGEVTSLHGSTRKRITLPATVDGDVMVTVHATRADGTKATTVGYATTDAPGIFTAAPVGAFSR